MHYWGKDRRPYISHAHDSLIFARVNAMRLVAEEGRKASWEPGCVNQARADRRSRAMWDGCWSEPADRLPTGHCGNDPSGVDDGKVRNQLLR